MAWSGSAVFAAFTAAAMLPADEVRGMWTAAELPRIRFALFSTAVTPNRLANLGAISYGTGEWQINPNPGRECHGPGWPRGGLGCALTVLTGPDGAVRMTAAAGLSAGPATILNMSGDLMYDAQSGYGLGFHDWGGPLDIGGGILAITWPPEGVIIINDQIPAAPRRRRSKRA